MFQLCSIITYLKLSLIAYNILSNLVVEGGRGRGNNRSKEENNWFVSYDVHFNRYKSIGESKATDMLNKMIEFEKNTESFLKVFDERNANDNSVILFRYVALCHEISLVLPMRHKLNSAAVNLNIIKSSNERGCLEDDFNKLKRFRSVFKDFSMVRKTLMRRLIDRQYIACSGFYSEAIDNIKSLLSINDKLLIQDLKYLLFDKIYTRKRYRNYNLININKQLLIRNIIYYLMKVGDSLWHKYSLFELNHHLYIERFLDLYQSHIGLTADRFCKLKTPIIEKFNEIKVGFDAALSNNVNISRIRQFYDDHLEYNFECLLGSIDLFEEYDFLKNIPEFWINYYSDTTII